MAEFNREDEFRIINSELIKIQKDLKESPPESWNKEKHDGESRLAITRLFLKWFFFLIIWAFVFAATYNFLVAYINHRIPGAALPYVEILNAVSLITTTLSSGVGFVIGYYFKNKEEN